MSPLPGGMAATRLAMAMSGGNGATMTMEAATAPPININRPSRPMLAREADAVYWMSRYVERAEHVARILLVNSHMLADVGELAPRMLEQQWQAVLTVFRMANLPTGSGELAIRVAAHMAFDAENPNSIVNCITRARENARGIRESISAEMWEQLNTLYWYVRSDEARARLDDTPDDFFRRLMSDSMLFQGLTDQTMPHDQRWHFMQLGKYFERIDVTCRVIETRYDLLRSVENVLETPLRNVLWMGVLRACCSIENYRRHHPGELDPLRVASFLVLQRDFPRTIRYCVDRAEDSIAAIRADVRPAGIDPAERVLGRLQAQLEFAEPTEILSHGLSAYLHNIQSHIVQAAIEIQRSYFLH
jgi:uncharacterized alpha-E superfamily protein